MKASAVCDARTAIYLRLKYRAWDRRNREQSYRRCFGYKERWAGLLREVAHLHDRGWEVGLESYNVVLRRYAGAGKWAYAEQTFAAMRDRGVPPDRTSFLLLLNAHARGMRRHNASAVLATWRRMVAEGHTPSPAAYHALVRAVCLLRRPSLAFTLIRALHRRDPGADMEPFFIPVIRAVSENWRCVRRLCTLLRRLQTRGGAAWAPSPLYHEAVLRAAALHGKVPSGRRAWEALRESTVRLTARHWAFYLRVHVRAGRTRRSLKSTEGVLGAPPRGPHAAAGRIWQRMKAAPESRIDDAGLKVYLQMCIAEVAALDGAARAADAPHRPQLLEAKETAIDNGAAEFTSMTARPALAQSIHVWGAYVELLAWSARPALAEDAYSAYLDGVGKPWLPTSAVAKRIARVRRLQNRGSAAAQVQDGLAPATGANA